MTIREAIEKAINKNYGLGNIWGVENGLYILTDNYGQRSGSLSVSDIFIDPAFWIALGKAMGWHTTNPMQPKGKKFDEALMHWHHLIDTLASGGSAESFFEQLT